MCSHIQFSILINSALTLLSLLSTHALQLGLYPTMSPAPDYFTKTATNTQAERARRVAEPPRPIQAESSNSKPVYHNPRLDPKNYLEGRVSTNPATRLRQMLARPGIVVRLFGIRF
jgi:hypothetical protein